MINLKKLKELTQDLTILYVEDSGILLKRMSMFFDNIFKEVYQASNGQEGIEVYNKYKPDIVVTDLNMPIMNGHKMIVELKKINPDLGIIIVSAYSDTANLLNSLHLGVSDFVPKPVDSKLLQNALLKLAIKATSEKRIVDQVYVEDVDKLENDITYLMKKFDIIQQSHIPVEVLNHYKGVPLTEKVDIVSVGIENITIKAPYFQTIAVKFEKNTVINSELFNNSIDADLESVNGYNNTIVLNNLRVSSSKLNKKKELNVVPGDEISAILKKKDKNIEFKLNKISKDSITITIDENNLLLKEGEVIDLEIIIEEEITENRTDTHNIKSKSEIYSINKASENKYNLVILFELENKSKETYDEYLTKRRNDLIVELKYLKELEF